MAAQAASFSSGGHGKSGKPCPRLMAPYCAASRNVSRITDSVNRPALALVLGISRSWRTGALTTTWSPDHDIRLRVAGDHVRQGAHRSIAHRDVDRGVLLDQRARRRLGR